MKKTIIIFSIIIMIISTIGKENLEIPKESIRFRIIANSNTERDQNLKKEIVKNISNEILNISSKSSNIEEVRENINQQISSLDKTVKKTLSDNNESLNYEIKYGMNYIPEKEYNGKTYKAGEYESIVIKLGEGKGENFWCVLFPPLCLLEVEETNEKIEYTSFIKEIIDKYF